MTCTCSVRSKEAYPIHTEKSQTNPNDNENQINTCMFINKQDYESIYKQYTSPLQVKTPLKIGQRHCEGVKAFQIGILCFGSPIFSFR